MTKSTWLGHHYLVAKDTWLQLFSLGLLIILVYVIIRMYSLYLWLKALNSLAVHEADITAFGNFALCVFGLTFSYQARVHSGSSIRLAERFMSISMSGRCHRCECNTHCILKEEKMLRTEYDYISYWADYKEVAGTDRMVIEWLAAVDVAASPVKVVHWQLTALLISGVARIWCEGGHRSRRRGGWVSPSHQILATPLMRSAVNCQWTTLTGDAATSTAASHSITIRSVATSL